MSTKGTPAILGLLAAGLFTLTIGQAAAAGYSSSMSSSRTSEITSQWVQFVPMYRLASTTGYGGRVGEYDSLASAMGGSITFTETDPSKHRSLKARAQVINEDDYNLAMKLQLGRYLDLSLDARSLVHHLDTVPFGNSPNAGDIVRTDTIPIDALLGVKRTSTDLGVRWKVPRSPVTLFVKSGSFDRRGTSQMRFYDMGGDAACGSCHQTSTFRDLRYDMHHLTEGFDVNIRRVLVTVEHDDRVFRDRRAAPVDGFGATFGPELPAGVNATPAGNYEHNGYPSNDLHTDTIRVRAPLSRDLTLTASTSGTSSRNVRAANRQDLASDDATLAWQPHRRWAAIVDYHADRLLNNFTPGAYTFNGLTQGPYAFGDPSLKQDREGLRLTYSFSKRVDAEVHTRRSNTTRSASELWPQVDSPTSLGLLGTVADPFVPRVVPATSSDTVGAIVHFRGKSDLSLRAGYDFTGTYSPGYLTDAQKTWRYFVRGQASPRSWLSLNDDFTLEHGDASFRIHRRNNAYHNTVLATLRAIKDLPLTLGYSYFEDSLATDTVLGSDPAISFYPQSLVPYSGSSQTYSISARYNIRRRLGAQLDWNHVKSASNWSPDLANPLDYQNLGLAGNGPLIFASQFTQVAVPQTLMTAGLDYQMKGGRSTGMRLQYAAYHDDVHPELDGLFRSLSIFYAQRF